MNELSDQQLDKIARFVIFNVMGAVATLPVLIATIAFFGPQLAPLMNKLPW